MSCNSGPNNSTNGLVFEFDMNNTKKSWKGAPTTNLFSNPNTLSTGWVGNQGGGSGTIDLNTTTTAPFGGVAYRIYGASGGSTWTQQVSGLSTATTYYISVYYLAVGWTPFFYSPANVTYGSMVYTAIPGSAWVKMTSTLTTTVTNPYIGIHVGWSPGTAYAFYWGIQLETSLTTPFISGTRSNTQVIADLTGKNTVTATSLTYASDGTFSFNGTSDYLTIPFNASLFTFNNEQTIIIWMKNNSPSAARRNPYDQAYAGGGTITHENDTNFNYYYGTQGGNGTPYTSITSSFSVVVGETAMICLTRNTSTLSWYKNGVLSNSTANPYGGTVVTGTNNIRIGTGYAGYFGGNLYNVQLYNRALSAAEVKQNFNALRGRYGL